MAEETDTTMTDQAVETETMATPKTPLPLRIAKWIGIAAAGLIGLVILAVLGLNTGPGKRFVVNQIEALELENGMTIDIGRIEGSLYSAMTIHDLSLKDPEGEFLYSPEVKVDWHPFAFAQSHLDIDSLTAKRMTLRKVPTFNETPPSNDPLLPNFDIDVRELRIDRFVAQPAVSGEERIATLAGSAHIADRRAQVKFNGTTLALPGGSAGDRIALVLDAVPEKNRLAIDLAVDAPTGGVITALAGLTQPLKVRLNGKGDWQAWDGTLAADMDGSDLARLDMTARDGTFAIKGPTRIARLFDGPTAQLLGPVMNIDLGAALDERRADLSGSVSSDAFRLLTDGIVDLGTSSFDGLDLNLLVTKPTALAENLSGRSIRALLTLNGGFATPSVNYQINAARIAMNDMALEGLNASGAASINADRILIPVDARVRRIAGLDTVAGGKLENVRLNGDLAIEGTRVLSDNMQVTSDRINAKAILLADTSRGFYTGALDGKIDNYRVESVGIFDIATDMDLQSEGQGFALKGRVRARSSQILNESVANFLGGNMVAAADVNYGSDGVARFSNLQLQSPGARINGGSGSYSPDGRIALNLDAATEQYGQVGVRVAGTISNPNATLTAQRPGLGIGLANLRADVTGARNGYRLNAKGDTDYGPLTADVVLGTGARTSLQINSANLGGIDFAGDLVQTRSGPFAGRLTANGNGLGGVVRLDARGQYQEALVNLRANDTVFGGPANLAIGSAVIDARVVLYDQPFVAADVQLAGTNYGAFQIAVARAQIDYRDGRGKAKLLAEGSSGIPFRIAANADLEPELWRASLKGRARGVNFATASPMRIIPKSGSYELLPTRINFGDGSVRLAGNYGNGLKLQSRLDSLDLQIVNAFMPGMGLGGDASGSLDFEQSSLTAFPRSDARLHIDNFTRTTAASVSQPIDINFVGKLLPDGGEARAVMRRRGTVIGRMVASLRPLPPGSGSWTTRLLSAPLGGGIRYNGPADTLFSFAGQPDQSLSGPIAMGVDFGGRVSRPTMSGVVRAKSLTYENQTYGTRLSRMALVGRFTGDRVEIEQLEAVAGDGTVKADGYVSLAAGNGYPMNISVALDDARLARSDALSATATGELSLTKSAGQTALLSGNIRLPETRYKIVRQGAAQVPELSGVRFLPPRGRQRITGDEPVTPEPGLFEMVRLDIDLDAPEKLYVSGMGLESEWRADMTIGGTSATPRLTGGVDLVRGTLGFAGRSFSLSEGRVRFTGGSTIDPTILLTATEDIEDVSVEVNVDGRAYDPQIAFSSTPGLPQDEIMSRILFGSSVANLSAVQAVQLAASLNSLRGSGGGLNPLGKLRAATGVDRLRILGSDEDTGRGTALAAGQYLTDDIYVEFITDARGFTATQLEVSLTPALSILSQAGGSGTTNVNVRYRKDY